VVCSREAALLGDCLSALRAQDVPLVPCVVLDGAKEAEAEPWRARFPEAWVIARPRQSGFGPCARVGLERARALGAEWALLLNDDVRLEPGALARLLEVARADSRCGAVAPVLLDERGAVNSFGLEVNLLGQARDRARGRTLEEVLRLAPVAIAASGAALLVRVAALEAASLDAAYRYYYEDVDLGLALLDAGWTVRLVPEARAVHLESQTIGAGSARQAHYLARNQVRFLLRTFPARHLVWTLPLSLARLALRPAEHVARGQWAHALACAVAPGALVARLPSRRPMRKRTFRRVVPRLRWD